MPNDPITTMSDPQGTGSPTQLGDLSTALRLLRPLQAVMTDSDDARRQLVADWLRLVGVRIGCPPEAEPSVPSNPEPSKPDSSVGLLSPRQEQTLHYLLEGDSEKQVARKLELSRHTIHVYVKQLYRRFGVSSRAELMSKHVRR